uniref:TadE/TadG family type IV pilus assembly protein n=1 Tax=Altererythrobacter segetis TaxID=1104773 RepID=UPI00140B1BE1|nr:TadE/TadG family type IV pilus assembly protein [Altererythrobacter segetis]
MLRFIRRLKQDRRGAAIVEFAILAPTLFAMIFGVVQVGIQMWCYNSLRSIAADAGRYTMVEYQKQNEITTDQIASKALAIAVNAPYEFDTNRLTYPDVQNPASDIAGMTKFTITMVYDPISVLDFIGVSAPTLTITRPIYVAS